MEQEKTIPFTLDHLDFEPNAFMGFTANEFLFCILIQTGVYCAILAPICSILFDVAMFGVVGATFLSVVLSVLFARIATTKKKGRPSYMLWVDIKRNLQINGVMLGLFKIRFGYVESAKWDVISEKKHNK